MSVLATQAPKQRVQSPARRQRSVEMVGQESNLVSDVQESPAQEFSYMIEPVLDDSRPREAATVIQLWECTVLDIDNITDSMRALLHAKIGEVEDHVADIDLSWVSPQDLDLVQPGAVFYLTLSRTLTRSRSIVNSQELRFRRVPPWTQREVRTIRKIGEDLYAKFAQQPA